MPAYEAWAQAHAISSGRLRRAGAVARPARSTSPPLLPLGDMRGTSLQQPTQHHPHKCHEERNMTFAGDTVPTVGQHRGWTQGQQGRLSQVPVLHAGCHTVGTTGHTVGTTGHTEE